MSDDTNLRALIRLIPPAKALKDDLEKNLHLEMFTGTGNMAVRTFRGLQKSVAALAPDPYVESLDLEVSETASDKEKVAMAMLAAGQLLAYLEGQTGVPASGGAGTHIQTAPNINIGGNIRVTPEILKKIMGDKDVSGQKDGEKDEDGDK